ncbi:glutathione S-transferase Mu 1-like isoform X1 [Xiphophorus couchianus]|uniref:glutathione S-transferase Mu 1-like isoform X1 n=1 Tax=Xiphophorus couchianus TaxID=32473 RepID=UPI0010171DCA|nr:glutathione S-transferase Mu 1-like isoform X1 [Xiphophorus couchianus]
MTMILAYWDVRGFAGHIRLMLEYTKANYKEKFYVVGDAPGFDKSCWFNEKFKLGLDFPNLPYLIDGDNKVTQSMAILRYLARKNNLCGDTEEQKMRIDMLEQQCLDLRASFVRMCYVDLEGLKPDYLKALPDALKLFSDFLGQRKWFAGDKVTYLINIKELIVSYKTACNRFLFRVLLIFIIPSGFLPWEAKMTNPKVDMSKKRTICYYTQALAHWMNTDLSNILNQKLLLQFLISQ